MSKAMPIEWHEKNLKCTELWILRQKGELALAQERLAITEDAASKLRWQILIAKQQGKKSFDEDRFLKNLKNKKKENGDA